MEIKRANICTVLKRVPDTCIISGIVLALIAIIVISIDGKGLIYCSHQG